MYITLETSFWLQIEVSSQVDTTSNGDVPSFSEESVMADVKQKEVCNIKQYLFIVLLY